MRDSAIDRIGVDVVRPNCLEATVRIGADGARGIPECATDVDMGAGVIDDQSGVVTAPPAFDFGDALRDGAGAREERKDGRQHKDSLHFNGIDGFCRYSK